MAETNLKNKCILDLWILIFGLIVASSFFSSIYIPKKDMIDYSTSFSAYILTIAIYLVLYVILILIGTYLLYCSNIKNHRYLVIYTQCKKTPDYLRKAFLIVKVIGSVVSIFALIYIWSNLWKDIFDTIKIVFVVIVYSITLALLAFPDHDILDAHLTKEEKQ